MMNEKQVAQYIVDAIADDDVSRLQSLKDGQGFEKRYNFSDLVDAPAAAPVLGYETPLHVATRMGKLASMRFLATIYDVNSNCNDHCMPPINLAVLFEQKEAAALLLKLGAQVKLSDEFNISALSLVEKYEKYDTFMPMIIGALSDKDRMNCYLHAGGYNNALHVVDYFLSVEGWDINTANESQQTALYFAAFQGHGDMVEALLERGANPNATTTQGITPLMAAARSPFLHEMQLFSSLMAAGANPYLVNKDQYTMFDIMRVNDVPDDVVAAIQKVVVLHEIKRVHDKLPDFKPIHKIKLKPR